MAPPRQYRLQLDDNDKSLWEAVVSRNKDQDGIFYYSVASTGVYCRPSCPSRLANRANVRFHASCAAAERAGFRPCKRCKPNQPALLETHTSIVAAACRDIETAEEAPSLDALAERSGLSPFHFHRIFKSIVGVTPKAYTDATRQRRVRKSLQANRNVTDAIHAAGFNSNGRFYARSNETLGMTPSEFQSGGSKVALRFAVGSCALGAILVAASEKGVAAILLGDDPEKLVHDLEDQFPNAALIGGDTAFEHMVAKVVAFVEAPTTKFDLPLDVRGTAFQHRVWQALQKIPAGDTVSYSQLAERIGSPKAVRAVASACAANTIAVAIPCHRVVRTDGSLSGYRWGVERKRALLSRERKP